MANVSTSDTWAEGNKNFFQGIQALHQGIADAQNSRRLDLEKQFYDQQAEQNRQNQVIEKLKVMPQAIQGLQNAGLDVTPEVVSGLSKSIGLSNDLADTLATMKPMTITTTDEQGNKTEVPINKVTAQYQAALAKGTESYRRGIAIQGLKNEGSYKVHQMDNATKMQMLADKIQSSKTLLGNKSINGMLNFIVKAHQNGMEPSDVDEALQNLQEAVSGIEKGNAPNPNAPAVEAPKAGGMFTWGKYSFTKGDLINKLGGSKGLSEARGGSTLEEDVNKMNTYLNQYKDNPAAQDKIISNFKTRWPEAASLLGGK